MRPSHQTVTVLKVEAANFALCFLIQFPVLMHKFQHCIGVLKSIVNMKQMAAAAPNYDMLNVGKDDISLMPS